MTVLSYTIFGVFSQLPAAKKYGKQCSCDVIKNVNVLYYAVSFIRIDDKFLPVANFIDSIFLNFLMLHTDKCLEMVSLT